MDVVMKTAIESLRSFDEVMVFEEASVKLTHEQFLEYGRQRTMLDIYTSLGMAEEFSKNKFLLRDSVDILILIKPHEEAE